ncbi:thiolase family protein [Janthinobacterium sp. 17J80-10]|uniref:thiolase family protein n=1 Tax=Janthinobacterium sp. 17J80-10 TaxID=2497863 RepID=UPI00100542DF|nr:thiolase family protein [Janthinobacterium sp. 17J80-10]QAU34127.1 thiolase family protein [Janthinobacterium sp. 17J80-10]
MKEQEIVLCSPVRTAIGAYNGTLKDVPATELGAIVVRETIRRAGIEPNTLGSVIMGNVIQAGNRMNPARQAALNSGVPANVPAMTVNRVCGSGLQAIISAAQEIQLGHIDSAIAGGMENMDQAPYLLPNGRWGSRMGDAQIYDSMLRDGLVDAFSGEHSGWHTEDLVELYKISREDQDRWAHRSQQRFASAQAAGYFATQIAGIEINGRNGAKVFDTDEANRPDSTLDALARLKPAFRKTGSITAGNAPGLNSGAAAMIVSDRRFADHHQLEPMAKIVSYGIAAVEPGLFGLGPVGAIRQALTRAGWTLKDVQQMEINEAFAAVPLAVMRELGIPEEIVNTDGGAIAHGHAIGATGAVLTARLLHAMRRNGNKRGIVTLCIGGGQGIALALEAL